MCRALLSAKADANLRHAWTHSALDMAAEDGRADLVRLLVDSKALTDPNHQYALP
jgi:ankyrin repeat protein